jgi:hypothetical protein
VHQLIESSGEAKTDALCNLGSHFYERNNKGKADRYWEQAPSLFSDSRNCLGKPVDCRAAKRRTKLATGA